MSRVKAFGLFWWDFIVGDDWRMAAGVVLLLGLCAVLAHRGVPAWWLTPLGVVAVLVWSLVRAVRRR